ncbi:MAG: nucleotide exchange factor GrpE [Alphaproteobacteria bacterium]
MNDEKDTTPGNEADEKEAPKTNGTGDEAAPEGPPEVPPEVPDGETEESTAVEPVELELSEAMAEDEAGEAAPEVPPEVPDAAELKDRLLRALAETENVRRRAEREREEVAKYAITNFARDVIAIADNLRGALESVPPEGAGENELLKTIVEGVEMTERELLNLFERFDIRRIEPWGEKFDYNLHQAMFEVPNSGKPTGTVVEVVRPGYVMGDRLLRPAMVGVAKEGDEGPEEPGRQVDTSA